MAIGILKVQFILHCCTHTDKDYTLILSHLSPIYLMSCVFTVHITFIYFDKHSPDLGRYTCLAPERFKRSICGPRPKKVVHHCYKTMHNRRLQKPDESILLWL